MIIEQLKMCGQHRIPMQPVKERDLIDNCDVLVGWVCKNCIDPYSGGFIIHPKF